MKGGRHHEPISKKYRLSVAHILLIDQYVFDIFRSVSRHPSEELTFSALISSPTNSRTVLGAMAMPMASRVL
jgi:hypothetical protein